MRSSIKVLLSAAAVALAGSAVIAVALPRVHHLAVRLPNGGVEQISYIGDVAPKVSILPESTEAGTLMPAAGFWAPFAGLDRISTQMDQMAAAMDHQMAIMMKNMEPIPLVELDGLTSATLRDLPTGTMSYSMVSTISGSNVCTREVQITGRGDGTRPEVVSHSSGNCGVENSPATVTNSDDSPANGHLIVDKGQASPTRPMTARQHI